jgi:hypothetical protein
VSEPHLMGMPRSGLFRVERWADLRTFPPAAEPSRLRRNPVHDGYRWEDLFGQFATAKFSETPSAAIGRSAARYQERRVADPDSPGSGASLSLIDAIKRFLIDEPDEGPLIGPANSIPPSYFEDAHQMKRDYADSVSFIDLEHAETHATLEEIDGDMFTFFGLPGVPDDISGNRDRRVTRLVTSLLYQWCGSVPGYEQVAGLRYSSHDPGWDGYVLWEPSRLRFADASIDPLSPCDDAVREAAAQLGVADPCAA